MFDVSHLQEWANLLVRFIHLVTGIMWIGSSFYFIWLDSAFEPPASPRPNVDGEVFMVHGGFYYQVEKKKIAPGDLPTTLHWFKWEATFTWITGFLLLALVYYLTGGVYLVDPQISSISPGQASLLGIGLLIGGWLLYDLLWRSPLAKRSLLASTLSIALAGGAVWLTTHTLSGRAAYIHIGALFGTLMVLNVWVHILPAQKKMLAQAQAGQTPDYSIGLKGKKRSVHNTYMTFPVLFIMLSNHFPSTYSHPQNWLVLILIIVAGALFRHVMVTKVPAQRWLAAPAAATIFLLMYLTGPGAKAAEFAKLAEGPKVPFATVRSILSERCLPCHSEHPTDDVFKVAPSGAMFDTPERVALAAKKIHERVFVLRNMPLANKTHLTDEERTLLGRWFAQGGKTTD
ncbi:MAG: urate hydroxylase PuuD [Myxococcales bacterium]|nr:urate hydroxylase PuuD [Myxococcales bacterium]